MLTVNIVGRKFDVTYVSKEELNETIALHADDQWLSIELFLAQSMLNALEDNAAGFEGMNLNELCPEVHPVGIEEFLRKWWGTK